LVGVDDENRGLLGQFVRGQIHAAEKIENIARQQAVAPEHQNNRHRKTDEDRRKLMGFGRGRRKRRPRRGWARLGSLGDQSGHGGLISTPPDPVGWGDLGPGDTLILNDDVIISGPADAAFQKASGDGPTGEPPVTPLFAT